MNIDFVHGCRPSRREEGATREVVTDEQRGVTATVDKNDVHDIS